MLKPELVLKFKHLFENQRREIFSKSVIDLGIVLQKEDMLDEVDMTTVEMETQMRNRLRSRETLFMKKVEEALKRISGGNFGVCEDCNDDISSSVWKLAPRPRSA